MACGIKFKHEMKSPKQDGLFQFFNAQMNGRPINFWHVISFIDKKTFFSSIPTYSQKSSHDVRNKNKHGDKEIKSG